MATNEVRQKPQNRERYTIAGSEPGVLAGIVS